MGVQVTKSLTQADVLFNGQALIRKDEYLVLPECVSDVVKRGVIDVSKLQFGDSCADVARQF
jgi:hypothetical protein